LELQRNLRFKERVFKNFDFSYCSYGVDINFVFQMRIILFPVNYEPDDFIEDVDYVDTAKTQQIEIQTEL